MTDFKVGDLALAIGLNRFHEYNGCVGKITEVGNTAEGYVFWLPLSGYNKKEKPENLSRGISISKHQTEEKLKRI